MRKIVAGLFMSLDGVVESPEEWHFPYFNDEMGEIVGGQMAEADTMLFGRKTYEGFAAYWPDSEDDFAAHMNNTPKLVASTTLNKVEWQNSTLIRGNAADELREIKEQPGKNIAITGSVVLVQSLLRDGLIDELNLLIHPIAVGSGQRLFAEGDRVPLKLVSSRTLSTGVIHAVYAPADEDDKDDKDDDTNDA